MQPLGRKALRFPSKTDCHPPRPLKNWWEVECGNHENKPAERQRSKRDIEVELVQIETGSTD